MPELDLDIPFLRISFIFRKYKAYTILKCFIYSSLIYYMLTAVCLSSSPLSPSPLPPLYPLFLIFASEKRRPPKDINQTWHKEITLIQGT